MSDTTFTLGVYVVRIALRPDNPAFPVYLVFRGKTFIDKQFSRPCESDCRWLEQHQGSYASESTFKRIEFSRGVYFGKGGPRVKREAHALDIPEDSAEPA